MPSAQSTLEHILGLLDGSGNLTCRGMMEEYLLYLVGKLFGGIYDYGFLLKKVAVLSDLISDLVYAIPYGGVKEMHLVSESCPELPIIVKTMCQHLRG